MRKWIIFKTDKGQPGWEERKYSHTGSFTKILCEHFDSSGKASPEPGYRPKQFVRVDASIDPNYPKASTHYRIGDWQVSRVETYTPEFPMGDFDEIVVCYCEYSPIDSPLKEMPDRQVSIATFDGDVTAYEQYLESQKEPVAA